jgi:iron complex outermembrane receptor protein
MGVRNATEQTVGRLARTRRLRMAARATLGAAGVGLLTALPSARAQDGTVTELPEVRVIATTPVSAPSRPRRVTRAPTRPAPRRAATPAPQSAEPAPAGAETETVERVDPSLIERDKVPAMVQSLSAEDIARTHSDNLTDSLFQRIPGVSISDPNGNSAQQEIRYRGFAASPLQGRPQGLAVYMNGIRLNEAFGDTVNWDLIPTNAIQSTDILTNNPIFGLNALGGAVNIQMKNGFIYQGLEADLMGGSFGRVNGGVQYGVQKGPYALYLAAQGLHDDGWRQKSPTDLGRFYSDLGWRNDRTEIHLIASTAQTRFGVAAATPIQLLARAWTSIYTTPQTTKNEMGLLALNGKYALTDTWSVQGNIYVRGFRQRHTDGNDADVEQCSGDPANPLFNTLCLASGGFPFQPQENFQILTSGGQPISCPPGPGDQCALTPYGTIDRTRTNAQTVGTSLQLANNDQVIGRDNHFIIGASVDHSWIDFSAASELGYIFPDLTIASNPGIPGNGAIIHTFGNIGYGPVQLAAQNTYYGVYALDTFDVTPRLSATAGARLNVAKISTADQLGNSPELNSSPLYERINPVTGLTYKLLPGVSAYGGYSESNRAPTPLELGCASAVKPCLLEGFLVADPPLKQVVGKTYEAGLRGDFAAAGGRVGWKLGLFRTDSINDIINVASAIQGRGSFQNVDATRRQGLEASVEYRSGRWLVYAGYSFLDATYQFTGDISSPNNPSADDAGNVHVTPGKHIPGIPQNQFKVGADYAVTPDWKVGGDVAVVGSQYFVGDDANQNVKLPAYWVANLHTSYQITKSVQVFGLITNLFNRKYALFGTYFEPQGVANVPLGITLTDQRTEVPGQPFSIYAGMRVKL